MKSLIILLCILSSTCYARVRVGYIVTKSAAAHISNVYNWVVAAHAFLNQGYINSGFAENDPNVSAILGYIRVDSSCTNDTVCANISRLADSSDGYFDYIFDDRITYNLDIIILVGNDARWCGYSFLAPDPNAAFVYLWWHCVDDDLSSLGHEIGHIIGARHHIQVDPANTVIEGDTFTYVHGYCAEDTLCWVDVMVDNYPCTSAGYGGNYYSDPDSLDPGTHRPRGDTTYADIVRFFSEKFYRYSNLHPIPATRDYSNSTVYNNDFNDMVATGNITSSNCQVLNGGGLQLRSNTGIYITPGNTGFSVNYGGYCSIVAGGNEPLGKRRVSQGNPHRPNTVSDLVSRNIIHTYGRNNNIIISYSLKSQPSNDVEVQLFDLTGRTLYKKVGMPSKNTLSIPINHENGKFLIVCLRKNNQPIMTRRFVKGTCLE